MLFAKGARPNAAAVRAFSRSSGKFAISLDPSLEGGQEEGWLELLASGLAFDLVGLAPQLSMEMPELVHRFGIENSFDIGGFQAITITPGPHLAAGGTMVPVVRTLATIVSQLAGLEGVRAVAWHPARSLCEASYFRNGVTRWIEGGPFPGLGLTALKPDVGGTMSTEGLAHLIGQELRLHAELVADKQEAAKLALRLINWLVEHGRISENHAFTGPSGETLILEPVENSGIVEVWRGAH